MGGGLERVEVVQPEASGLAGVVAKLPRLDDLVRWPDAIADAADRVLDRPAWDLACHQPAHKVERGLCLRGAIGAAVIPVQSAAAKVGAGWVKDANVPRAQRNRVEHVALKMWSRHLAGQKVTAHGMVPGRDERIAHRST